MTGERPVESPPDTSVSPEHSRVQVEHVLRRHGARGISCAHDGMSGRITVSSIMPESATTMSHEVAVQLPIDVRRVYDRLYGQPFLPVRGAKARCLARGHSSIPRATGYDSRKLEHAERVAWRHLLQWLDSVLAAAAAGFQTMSEAFFADTVVAFDDGRHGRLVDYLESENHISWRLASEHCWCRRPRTLRRDDGCCRARVASSHVDSRHRSRPPLRQVIYRPSRLPARRSRSCSTQRSWRRITA